MTCLSEIDGRPSSLSLVLSVSGQRRRAKWLVKTRRYRSTSVLGPLRAIIYRRVITVIVAVDAFAEITVKWHSLYQLARYASTPRAQEPFGSCDIKESEEGWLDRDIKRREVSAISESAGRNLGEYIAVSWRSLAIYRLSTRDRRTRARLLKANLLGAWHVIEAALTRANDEKASELPAYTGCPVTLHRRSWR